MKNFGKVIFSTGLAFSLGTFLIASPLLAETAKTDKSADKPAAEAPAAGVEKKEGDKAAAPKPAKKKTAAASKKKTAAKKEEGHDKMKPAEEKKMEAPADKK